MKQWLMGFMTVLLNQKTLDGITATSYDSFVDDHRHIIEICQSGIKVPRISLEKAEELLRSMKPV